MKFTTALYAVTSLETYFDRFHRNIIGNDASFLSPYGKKNVVYADWTASGRLYALIEERLMSEIMPLVANTHSESTTTGAAMTNAYHEAKHIIKKHVNASENDVLLFCGSGMTAAVNKLQRILGLRIPERIADYSIHARDVNGSANGLSHGDKLRELLGIDHTCRPIVFCTMMEHHSNHTSWLETIAEVVLIRQTPAGLPDVAHLLELLEGTHPDRMKIAAITACSNVTGIRTPYQDIARAVHKFGGYCFVDFACSAPYVSIDMHPHGDEAAALDAIMFSPHKFLGGPGTPGVLIFNGSMYRNTVPDHPGGGTVFYTNPWNRREYFSDIETREDGGTPPFLQGIKTALCVKLKEEMGVENILAREHEINEKIFHSFDTMGNIILFEGRHRDRLGVFSFVIDGVSSHLVVKLLNDRFGIQTRGGCSCAGSYGHSLLSIEEEYSLKILGELQQGDSSNKPGWVRMSIHPTMKDEEIDYILNSIREVAAHHSEWAVDYQYNPQTNEMVYCGINSYSTDLVQGWFTKQLS